MWYHYNILTVIYIDLNQFRLSNITTLPIVPFHNDIPLAVTSLNNVNQLILYNNQQRVVKQYFTNSTAIQNMGYYNKFDSTKYIGGILLICKDTIVRVYRAWIKIYFYVQKHIAARVVLSSLSAGSLQAAQGRPHRWNWSFDIPQTNYTQYVIFLPVL